MSSYIHTSSTKAGGRIVAHGADADDRLVFGLVGNTVFVAGVAGGSSGRVVNDHGDGGLNAAETDCWRKPEEPLDCMLSRSRHSGSKTNSCKRND